MLACCEICICRFQNYIDELKFEKNLLLANYGTAKSTNQTDNNFHKYRDLTIKQLKKELAQLKHRVCIWPPSFKAEQHPECG